ncbi:MAG: DUF2341 domain-containing protein [Chitinivibrionales bacterium]|nr:DUF2341 domain-containing protein [Chitinivibrionales bacterium]
MKNIIRSFFTSLSTLVFVYCASPGPTANGGSGTETTTGVTAVALLPDGSPAAGARVRLRRGDWVSPLPALAKKAALVGADALTDSNGRFKIAGIDPGSYCLEVNDPSANSERGGAALFAFSIDVGASINLGVGTLRAYGTIAGALDTAGRAGQRLYAQVVGLARLAAVDSSGRFTFSDLPAGTFTVRVVTANDTAVAAAAGIFVGPGERTDVTLLSGWRFSKRLYLNTTATGANVVGPVADFPMLVRLTAGNFNFSQAVGGGADIRFIKPDGSPLPYEIEQWDSANAQAAIWVKVDTVYGNDNTHFLLMYWGASTGSATLSQSNGAAVFDTTGGFAGVWHMNNPPLDSRGDSTAALKDATSNAVNGTSRGAMTSANLVDGIIGRGCVFDGNDDFFDLGNPAAVNLQTNITLEAWISPSQYPDSTSGNPDLNDEIVINKLNSYSLEFEMGGNIQSWEVMQDSSTDILTTGNLNLSLNAWHYVAVTYDQQSQNIYVDGQLAASQAGGSGLSANANHLFVGFIDGASGQDRYFTGSIDEVRMSRTVRSADWLKLCFMNQKQNDALVVFK